VLPNFVDANRISYEDLFKERPAIVPYFLFNLVENVFVVVPVKVAAMAIAGALVGGVMAMILGWGDRRGSKEESLARSEEAAI